MAEVRDKLNLSWDRSIPQFRWWEWVWYVAVVVASALSFDLGDAWLHRWLVGVPVLGWAPFLLTWPLLLVLSWPVFRYLLPDRAARLRAPGEAWLIAGIWLGASWVEGFLPGFA